MNLLVAFALALVACVTPQPRSPSLAEQEAIQAEEEARRSESSKVHCDPMHVNRSYEDDMACGQYFATRANDPQQAIWWWKGAYVLAAGQQQACPPVMSILHWSKQPAEDLKGADSMIVGVCREKFSSCQTSCKAGIERCIQTGYTQACVSDLTKTEIHSAEKLQAVIAAYLDDCFSNCIQR